MMIDGVGAGVFGRHSFVANRSKKIMADRRSEREYRSDADRPDHSSGRYRPEEYFSASRELGRARDSRDPDADDEELYDEYYSGKRENYKGEGYYGSNYGNISEPRLGRDYEDNAGYRDNYEALTTGQWPEIERAAASRGMDLRTYELKQRGVHRGKGPKTYQRSDQRIIDDVNDVLTDDPYVDASDIEVNVTKGEVMLKGMVENKGIKRRVEDLVEDVSGVKHVENRLRLRFPGGQIVNIRNAGEK